MDVRKCGVISFFLSVMVVACSGQKYSPGSCPTTLQSVANPALTFAQLVGVWKEYARSKAPQQHSWKCTTYTITQATANVWYAVTVGGRKKLSNTALRTGGTINIGGSTGATATATTYLAFALTEWLNTKTLNYYIRYLDNPTAPATISVLALYACSNLGIGKVESAILLVKSGATDANIVSGLQALAENGFPSASLYFNYQADCLVI